MSDMSESGRRSWRRGRPSILAGRAIATGFTALFLAIIVSGGPAGAEGTAFVIMLALVAAAVAIAWWEAGLGVLALTGGGLALAVLGAIIADRNQVPVALLLGGPYLVAAGLMWFGLARLSRA